MGVSGAVDCQAGVGPLFLTGLQRGPHASRLHFPFLRAPGPQGSCSSMLAEEAGLGFLLALSG